MLAVGIWNLSFAFDTVNVEQCYKKCLLFLSYIIGHLTLGSYRKYNYNFLSSIVGFTSPAYVIFVDILARYLLICLSISSMYISGLVCQQTWEGAVFLITSSKLLNSL